MQKGLVVEPVRDLYKVEVRALGEALGIDAASLDRHPFPGPGLGIRVACESSVPHGYDEERLRDDMADALEGTGLAGVPLPVRSVGVKADLRSYEHPLLMTGDDPGWERLSTVATGLAKRVRGINRCLFEITGARPTRAALVPATVTRERLDLLRALDDIVMRALERHGLMRTVWQCPSILVPVSLDGRGRELLVIRPVHSERAMTARPADLGPACRRDIVDAVRPFTMLSGVAVDATSKPPGTIEWE